VAQGSNNHGIIDLWITLDNQDLGVWPVDRTVPFLPLNDPAQLTIFPGVRINGDFTSSFNYPFYDALFIDKNFVEGAVDTMTLDFQYNDQTLFSFIEDFEGVTHLLTQDDDDDPDSFVEVEEQNGSQVAALHVKPGNETLNVSTNIAFSDVIDKGFVFVEMDYKAETTFVMGLTSIDNNDVEQFQGFIFLTETDGWNKIYLNVSEEVLVQNAKSYRVSFNLTASSTTAEESVYIDNIKLVHF